MANIAINGFGRIGRQTFKRMLEQFSHLEIVALNDLTDTKTLAHLLKHDSNYGTYHADISYGDGFISVNGKKFTVLAEARAEKLPWKKLRVDIVLECTGFVDGHEHLKAGAKKVIISAPAKEKEIPGFNLGVNEDTFDPAITIMDMGSCTTNCLTTTAKVLNDTFGIVKGFMTTVHSYTNDQKILDLPHKDLRRARAAGLNIIPTYTGAAKSIGKIIPELNGKLDGIAMRVPTPVVSVLDLIVQVKKPTTKEAVNDAFKKAAESMKGILRVEEDELVSMDFKGDPHSSIIDVHETMVNGDMVKVVAWYDNEWGYSCRLAEFTNFVAEKL